MRKGQATGEFRGKLAVAFRLLAEQVKLVLLIAGGDGMKLSPRACI